MGAIKTLADNAWRDHVTPGSPGSGAHQVPKADVRKVLALIDALNRHGVKSATTTAQPGSPAEGDAYILPASQTGAAWSTMTSGSIAVYVSAAWVEVPAVEGLNVWVDDVNQRVRHDGSAWAQGGAGEAIRVSAADRIVGSTTAAGPASEIPFTSTARALCDDTSVSAMRATLEAPGLTVANVFNGGNQTVEGDAARSIIMRVAADAANAQFLGRRARGSIASQTSVQNGDNVFSFVAEAHDGTSYSTLGGLSFFAASTWSSAKDSYARITTTIAGSFGERWRINASGHIVPGADNVQNLGAAGLRHAVVYAGTGSINTSDAREKTKFTEIPEGVKRAVRRIISGIGVYQWLHSVADKGEAARLHVGVTAQAIQEAFAAEGEDAARWALFCADEIFEEVEVEEEVESLQPVEQEVWAYELVQDEASAKLSPVVMKTPVLERVPLLDAVGEPVTRDGVAVVVERPKYERRTTVEKRSVERPVLAENGQPLVRLGVRYDQLGMLALAVYADALNAAAP